MFYVQLSLMTLTDMIGERKAAVKQEFDSLKSEQTEKQARVEEIEKELLRLQGEYRVLESLTTEPGTPEAEVIDPLTITATEDVDKAKKKAS